MHGVDDNGQTILVGKSAGKRRFGGPKRKLVGDLEWICNANGGL
jgi:hypothetical protein